MFMLEDADFKPLVDAVKDAGKKTLGIHCKETCPSDLTQSFDARIWLSEASFRGLLKSTSFKPS
jgi:uncharacterized LabA/DUF88 family protein